MSGVGSLGGSISPLNYGTDCQGEYDASVQSGGSKLEVNCVRLGIKKIERGPRIFGPLSLNSAITVTVDSGDDALAARPDK